MPKPTKDQMDELVKQIDRFISTVDGIKSGAINDAEALRLVAQFEDSIEPARQAQKAFAVYKVKGFKDEDFKESDTVESAAKAIEVFKILGDMADDILKQMTANVSNAPERLLGHMNRLFQVAGENGKAQSASASSPTPKF